MFLATGTKQAKLALGIGTSNGIKRPTADKNHIQNVEVNLKIQKHFVKTVGGIQATL